MKLAPSVILLVVLLVCCGTVVPTPLSFGGVEEDMQYKWSPLWFRDFVDKYQLKRVNSEKPVQRFHPSWLQRNGYYFMHKRDSSLCSPELSSCDPTDFSEEPQCCMGLRCSPFNYLCVAK